MTTYETATMPAFSRNREQLLRAKKANPKLPRLSKRKTVTP